MELSRLLDAQRPKIDEELKNWVHNPRLGVFSGLSEIISYQLDWSGEGAGTEAQGKRLRPLLVTLCAAAVGENWEHALPAAAAVELLHNFSLIHDDIEDDSQLRRGRPTVWAKWGRELAINAGDAMYALAFSAAAGLDKTLGIESSHQACCILSDACIQLTGGQHLDILYQGANRLALDSYWPMVTGKTAALLGACTELGALCGGADSGVRKAFKLFGYSLGLAFQIQDDWLGIWGEESITGKSALSDILSRKKSLPVLFGLENDPEFLNLWSMEPMNPAIAEKCVQILVSNGAREFAESQADQYLQDSLKALEQVNLKDEAEAVLRQFTLLLVDRRN
jgi:geranylgeranyl diphosphate synthase type I